MGNQAAKVGEEATKGFQTVKKRMTVRRRRPEDIQEFSVRDIQQKFKTIPVLTQEEKDVLRSSWAIIKQKLAYVSYEN